VAKKPRIEPSLEDYAQGLEILVMGERESPEKRRVKVDPMPLIFQTGIEHLKAKIKGVGKGATRPYVHRVFAKIYIPYLEKVLNNYRTHQRTASEAFMHEEESEMEQSLRTPYSFSVGKELEHIHQWVYCSNKEERDILFDLNDISGLAVATLVKIGFAYCFSISRDESWIPKSYREKCDAECKKFEDWAGYRGT